MLGRASAAVLRRSSTPRVALASARPFVIRSFATAGSNVQSFLNNKGKEGKGAAIPAAAQKVLGQDGGSSSQRLRAVLPERKANTNSLYDPPYPKNTLGEFGNNAIQLYADVKAAGEDAASVSKQLTQFQEALAADADLNDMLLLPPSKGALRTGKVGIEIPFMKGKTLKTGTPPAGLSATRADRDARLNALFTKLKFSKPVQTLLRNLSETKGALSKVSRLQALFDELSRYERNEVLVTLKTVEPLGKDQLKKLQSKLRAATAPGQKLVFKEEIDPKILGGLVIFYGDKTQDLSVATRVKNLQKLLQTQSL